jgi:hypothetical protein
MKEIIIPDEFCNSYSTSKTRFTDLKSDRHKKDSQFWKELDEGIRLIEGTNDCTLKKVFVQREVKL